MPRDAVVVPGTARRLARPVRPDGRSRASRRSPATSRATVRTTMRCACPSPRGGGGKGTTGSPSRRGAVRVAVCTRCSKHADFADRSGWSHVVQAKPGSTGSSPSGSRRCWTCSRAPSRRRSTTPGLCGSSASGGPIACRSSSSIIPSGRLAGPTLAALLAAHEFGTPAVRDAIGQLRFGPMTGFMKGYIDLVFACEGRFWLVDYKSNWLGEELDDYATDRLEAVVAPRGALAPVPASIWWSCTAGCGAEFPTTTTTATWAASATSSCAGSTPRAA